MAQNESTMTEIHEGQRVAVLARRGADDPRNALAVDEAGTSRRAVPVPLALAHVPVPTDAVCPGHARQSALPGVKSGPAVPVGGNADGLAGSDRPTRSSAPGERRGHLAKVTLTGATRLHLDRDVHRVAGQTPEQAGELSRPFVGRARVRVAHIRFRRAVRLSVWLTPSDDAP